MASCFGVTLLFFSIWIMKPAIQDTFLLTDISIIKCRIAGITVITDKKKGGGFDYSEAGRVCTELGLTLARSSQVEKAQEHGFETCSFGWVAEKYVVIARIIPNIKCGRNQTGVIPWKGRPLNYKARGYCYNSSDIWINSCIPEEASTTALPDVSTETNSTSTISFEDTSAMAQTSEPLQTKRHQECRIICRPEIIPPTELTTEDMALVPKNQAAFRNDVVVFGGVPTTLLVLALIFFAAATVLAVCYIKRYRQTLPSSKKKKNELIETKDIKETKATLVPEQEAKNGKKIEELPAKTEQAKCLEAEV